MAFNKSTTIVAGALTIGIIVFGLEQANATTQEPMVSTQRATPTVSQVADLGLQTQQSGGSQFTPLGDVNKQISTFIGDVTGFVQKDIFGTLNGLISSTIGAIKIPDFNQIVSVLMQKPTSSIEGTKLSEILEGKSISGSSGSYSIMDDYSKHAQRTAAINSADTGTLGSQAQAQSAQMLAATKQDTETNIQLANDSQNQDVTQRILQNISQQTALNAQTNEKILREAQQSRTDGAISNILAAQTSKEVAAKNTSDRRQDIAAGNQASQQSGMFMMPGGFTLKNDSKSNGNNWFLK